MKTLFTILSLLLLICLTPVETRADNACTNATYGYTGSCHDGGCTDYIRAYYDDSTPDPPQSKDGNTLHVTWPVAGSGHVDEHVTLMTGDEFDILIPVTITKCLNFSAAPPAFLCSGSSAAVTFTDTQASSSYTWTAPSGWSINGGSNTLNTTSKSVTVTAPTPASGHNTISVSSTISGTLTADVWGGAPVATLYRIWPLGHENVDPVTLSVSTTYAFYADPVIGATNYTWTFPSGFTWGTGSHTGSPVNIKTPSGAGTYILSCSASNSCGSSNMHTLHITTSTGGGGGKGKVMAMDAEAIEDTPYPIPASESFTINLSQPTTISVINFQGTVVRQVSAEGQATISTNDLNAGVYIVKLQNKSGLKQYRVTVSK